MSPTINQHYVPRVYIKNWETTVYSLKEPRKPFQGVYEFKNHNLDTGNGITKEKVLCNNHTYTIDRDYFFVVPNCNQVALDLGCKISDILADRNVVAYYQGRPLLSPADLGNAIIYLENWSFVDKVSHSDCFSKPSRAIKNQISELRSYVIEDKFSTTIENDWQSIYANFITAANRARPSGAEKLRHISPDITNRMLLSLFLMAFRNPSFDFAGIYPMFEDAIITPTFEALSDGDPQNPWAKYPQIIKRGFWITEIYKALFGVKKSAFSAMINNARKHLKIILFEAKADCGGVFITSDNPAFFHISRVELTNMNGVFFPLSPKHLIFLAYAEKGTIYDIDYRLINLYDLQKLNRIILSESVNSVISNRKYISNLL